MAGKSAIPQRRLVDPSGCSLLRRGGWLGAGVVNMYAPWCSHCIKAAPEYKAAAERMDGEVEFGALNCAQTRL